MLATSYRPVISQGKLVFSSCSPLRQQGSTRAVLGTVKLRAVTGRLTISNTVRSEQTVLIEEKIPLLQYTLGG